jgi:hypothetical protein
MHPVPEPTALPLLGSGLFAILFIRRRQKKSAAKDCHQRD